MTDKDPKDMTVSEQLRWAANGEPYNGIDENIWTYPTGKIRALAEAVTGEWPSDNEIFSIIADKIDAELAQARELSLLRGAELWAKANGWPDFREGEDFGAWLERCAIPRPRYDDGEPVQDADLEEIGSLATCYVYTDGSWVFDPDPYEDERNPKAWCKQCGDRDDRVKCPAPEVLLGDGKPVSKGETAYVTDSGIERTVKGFGTKLCEGMDGWDGSPWVMFDNGSWMHARDLTHERPVLGADGKPLKVGETVWNIFSGIEGIIKALNLNGESTAYVEWGDGRWSPGVLCDRLTHTTPDNQECIDADARKDQFEYWQCRERECDECPAEIEGMSPKKRYECNDCCSAMALDLLRRQRELDAKGGE